MRAVSLVLGLAVLLAACGEPAPTSSPCPTAAPSADEATTILADATTATVTTSLGTFTITLDPSHAPIATANFVNLARCGFYDGQSFHRVLAGFVIQAGDPQTRDDHGDFAGLGTGGPGYAFEIEVPPVEQPYSQYAVAMANTGQANSNGSQWFVCLVDLDDSFRSRGLAYSIFGHVSDGTDVVDAIGLVPVNSPDIGLPVEPVIIESIVIGGPA